MQPRFLEKRLEILEGTVEGLSELPARVEALGGQVSQLRVEMRSEFSAVREELRAGDDETRRHARILHEDAISQIKLIAEGHEETQRQIAVVRGEVGALRGEVGGLSNEVGALRGEVGGLSNEVGALRGEVGGLSNEVGALRGEVGGLSSEVGALRGEVGGLSSELSDLRSTVTTFASDARAQFKRLNGLLTRRLVKKKS